MRKLLLKIDRHLEECLVGIALSVMSLLVFLQVVMRYLFHAPMSWSDEVAVYCMVWSVYLAAAWAVRERAHIRVLNFLHLFPKPIQVVLMCVSDLIWLLCSVFIFWQGILLDMSLWKLTYESPVLGINQKWPYMIIAVGFGLMIYRQLQVYYEWLRYGRSPLETADAGGAGYE
jgi:C4-dicarboxylate transporter DctM subunit